MAVEKNKLNEDASLVRFCKIVLGWDYFRLVEESSKRSKDKRNKVKDEYVAGLGLKEVKDTYKDVDDYFATFEPLLFEEVKAQIVQGRDDEEDVTGWRPGAIKECAETNEFHSPMVVYECDEDDTISHNDTISQNDLLLLKASNNLRTYAFAFVEHCRPPNGVKLKMYLAGEVKGTMVDEVKSCSRLLNMRTLVSQVGKSLEMLKICSLSTIFREYVALRSISSLPFKDLILKADESSSESENRAWKIPGPLMESIKDNYNESQRGAIHAGLSRRAFVLIQGEQGHQSLLPGKWGGSEIQHRRGAPRVQKGRFGSRITGPPGTGKTQTILGLLSAILHATPAIVHSKNGSHEIKRGPELPIEDKYKHWGLASPWLTGINPRDQIMPVDGDDGFFPTTGNDFKPEVVNSSRKYRVRVLVCAPSNSALDEIVLRLLKTGLRDENDRVYNPKIVRIGLKPHHSVQSVAMDYLAEQRLAGVDLSSNKQKHGTGKDINNIIRASILDESVIVFSTLSFSGSRLFSKLPYSFDVVIIDEAAQAVEPATLIPLATGCKQVFLVGDPVQLPATVISPIAEKFGYKTSLFKRFQNAGYPVQMLKTQYRMHPEIRSFPSSEFYEDELEDAPNVKKQTRRPWHAYRCFGPFCFFDIHEGKESRPSGSGSWVNVDEVEFVLLLYHKLVTAHPKLKSSSQLAIITPYIEQVKLFRKCFLETFGVESKEVVDINTVDGFQGREKDVAIFSCVRASEDKGIGFVDDFRRMNVAITRARSSVLVVGSASTLKRGDEHWKNLIESAEKRDSLCKVSKPYSSFFSVENLKSMEAAIDDGMDLDMEDLDEMERNVASYGNPTADAAPEDENDYGDGRDADAGDFEED